MDLSNGKPCFLWIQSKVAPGGDTMVPRGSVLQRQEYHARQNGTYTSSNGPDGRHTGKAHVALIKPYIVSRHADTDDPTRVQHFPMDKCRVFGKAISNAMPFEMVDVMLSRQAI